MRHEDLCENMPFEREEKTQLNENSVTNFDYCSHSNLLQKMPKYVICGHTEDL